MHFKHNPGLDEDVFCDCSIQSPNINKMKIKLGWDALNIV